MVFWGFYFGTGVEWLFAVSDHAINVLNSIFLVFVFIDFLKLKGKEEYLQELDGSHGRPGGTPFAE